MNFIPLNFPRVWFSMCVSHDVSHITNVRDVRLRKSRPPETGGWIDSVLDRVLLSYNCRSYWRAFNPFHPTHRLVFNADSAYHKIHFNRVLICWHPMMSHPIDLSAYARSLLTKHVQIILFISNDYNCDHSFLCLLWAGSTDPSLQQFVLTIRYCWYTSKQSVHVKTPNDADEQFERRRTILTIDNTY